jgi:hypothetical protein
MQSIAANLFHSASVNHPNDVNRDGRVDAFDLQAIPVASGGAFNSNVLAAITPQAGPPPLAGISADAVDEAVAEEDSSPAATAYAPSGDGLGGLDGPADERVGDEEATDRDLAFTTFGNAAADGPLHGRLYDPLASGRLTL